MKWLAARLRVKAALYSLAALFAVMSFGATPVSAACNQDSILGIPTWHKYLEDEVVAGKCTPILRRTGDDPSAAISPVLAIGIAALEIAATLGSFVALIMVFWGAFNFMTSLGEPDKAASARKTVQNAAIGLAILLVSTRVVAFVGATVT